MSCRIELSNFQRSYFPGNQIIGKVICDLQSSEDMKGISVKLTGLEKVRWTEEKHINMAKNKFIKLKISLAEGGTLRMGVSEYPFTITLPHELPSSFKGRYGSVTYILKAKVDRSLKFNYKQEMKLPIISPIDQSMIADENLLSPKVYEVEKTVWCWGCAGGLVSMEVNLEKRSFVPGETINIATKVTNQSTKRIKNVKAQCWMEIKYTVPKLLGNESISERIVIAKTKEDGVGAREEKYYKLVLQLPMIDAVPNFLNSKILSVTTTIEVMAVFPKFHLNLAVQTFAFLSDIPIGGRDEYYVRIEKSGVYVPKEGEEDIIIKTINPNNILRLMSA